MKRNYHTIYSLVILVSLLSMALCEEPRLQEITLTCKDVTKAKAEIVPKLESSFFSETKKSYRWHIMESKGKLVDTLDGTVDAEDRVQIEHAANCVSTHQGKHAMDFCDASIANGSITFMVFGGLPAYASLLKVKINRELDVTCAFEASYPAPVEGLGWRITKKSLRLRNQNVKAGERLYGWLSIEFEERSEQKGKVIWKPHKIEGYFKPILRKSVAKSTNR